MEPRPCPQISSPHSNKQLSSSASRPAFIRPQSGIMIILHQIRGKGHREKGMGWLKIEPVLRFTQVLCLCMQPHPEESLSSHKGANSLSRCESLGLLLCKGDLFVNFHKSSKNVNGVLYFAMASAEKIYTKTQNKTKESVGHQLTLRQE